ncbi:MAG: hypothetical protein AB7P34_21770, partial [Vicinamibacterales bacterium]
MERLRIAVALFVAGLAAAVFAQSPPAIVLVTLDGARWEEVFGGLDAEIVKAGLRPDQRFEDQPLYKRFWAATPEERRKKLMPFFWGTLMREHGSIAGNPALKSRVHLANGH